MIDAETAAQVENFNTAINELPDDTTFRIQHGQGGFTLEYEYDSPQWEPAYGDNGPKAEEYGADNQDTPMTDSKYLNHDNDIYANYIGAKEIIDEKYNNDVNLSTVIR